MEAKSKATAYILWFISGFGWLGFHRFYLRKKKTAVLWIFTAGLCGIGLIYDLFTLSKQVDEYNGVNHPKTQKKKSVTKSEKEADFSIKSEPEKKEYKPPVFDENHNRIDYESTGKDLIPNEDYCFIADGGKTYHTHTFCYKNWSKEYQDSFTGWTLIPIEKAREKGITKKCRFCDSYDLSPDDFIKKYYPNREVIIAKLKNNRDDDSQLAIGCVSENARLRVNYDEEKSEPDNEAYFLSAENDKYNWSLGYLSKPDIGKLRKLIDDEEKSLDGMEALVYSIDIDDNGNSIITVAVLV